MYVTFTHLQKGLNQWYLTEIYGLKSLMSDSRAEDKLFRIEKIYKKDTIILKTFKNLK